MVKMMDNDEEMGPINIGNPTEFTMLELAKVRNRFTKQGKKTSFACRR